MEKALEALTTLWNLDLQTIPVSHERLQAAVKLARTAGITEYDAFYIGAASENNCPLVTANPRHQGQALGCEVIPLKDWHTL